MLVLKETHRFLHPSLGRHHYVRMRFEGPQPLLHSVPACDEFADQIEQPFEPCSAHSDHRSLIPIGPAGLHGRVGLVFDRRFASPT